MSETAKKILFYISFYTFIIVYGIQWNSIDWDFWARIIAGKAFVQIGHVLPKDIFSFTPTKPLWIDHEWGSGVVFYSVMSKFGDIGLVALKLLLILLFMIILQAIVKLKSKNEKNNHEVFFYLAVFLTAFYGLGSVLRCQCFTFVFFALWVYLLERIRIKNEQKWFFAFPLMTVLWANLHGGFVAGFALLFLYEIGEFLNRNKFKNYIFTLIACITAGLINPYGLKYYNYLFDAVTMSRPHITEWKTSFLTLSGWIGYKVLFLCALIGFIFYLYKCVKKAEKPDYVKILVVIFTMYESAMHIKHQPLFAVGACAFLYHDFYEIFNILHQKLSEKFGKIYLKAHHYLVMFKDMLLPAILISLSLYLSGTFGGWLIVDTNKYPAKSIEFIKINNIKGNVITVFHWGSYSIWKLYPDSLLAIDGRYEETYSNEVFDDVYDFNYHRSKLWDRALSKYPINIAIVQTSEKKTVNGMLKKYDWKRIYSDKTSTVFVKKELIRNKTKFLIPNQNKAYYNKTKFITNIDFKNNIHDKEQ